PEAVSGPQLVERNANRKQLAHGADQHRMPGIDVVDHFAAIEVDDAQSPERVVVFGLAEDLSDLGRRLLPGVPVITVAARGAGKQHCEKDGRASGPAAGRWDTHELLLHLSSGRGRGAR